MLCTMRMDARKRLKVTDLTARQFERLEREAFTREFEERERRELEAERPEPFTDDERIPF